MIILLALIALVFVHIAYKDIKHRLVYRYDLLALVALRVIALVVVLVGDYCFGVSSVLGLTGKQWGIPSLVLSVALALIACAFVQGVAYITNRLTNKYGAKEESIGLGDVKLYAVCCLFVTVEDFCRSCFYRRCLVCCWLWSTSSVRNRQRFPSRLRLSLHASWYYSLNR